MTTSENQITIYAICNSINNHAYIGQSSNVRRRWRQHRLSLERGSHGNPYLQSAWQKYGVDNFEWVKLDSVPGVDAAKAESEWVSWFRDLVGDVYNLADPFERDVIHPDTQVKMRNSQKRRRSSPEGRTQLLDSLTQARAVASTPECRNRQGESLSAFYKTPEGRMQLALRPPPPREHMVKMNQKSTEKSRRAVFCLDTGQIYESLTLAASVLGVRPSAVRDAILRKGRCKGVRFIYAPASSDESRFTCTQST